MHDGDLIELDITGIAHGGVFVARHEGRVVFVPDTLPGERIRARLTDTRKKAFWRADAIEVLRAAPERRPHVWGAAAMEVAPAERVGGAEFGHIALEHQRALKERVIREAVQRVGRLDLPVDVRSAGDAGGFWQVHRLAARTLTSLVATELTASLGALDPEATHLDLYGGVGLFAATLGDLGGSGTRVVSVESDPRATEHAGENLVEWVGARAETARVDRFVGRLAADASERERERLARGVVLLDPPRAGAGATVVEAIAALAPAAVVYVACDPVALARDLATFSEHGYRVHDGIRGVDLFPNSHHVEAVAVLRR